MPGARRSVAGARRRVAADVTVLNESFTGANGTAPGANWTNPRTTTGALVSIQSNQLSVTSGTLGSYTGKGGIQTVVSVSDFDLYADYTVQSVGGVATECFPMLGFRSSSSWSTTHGSALNSYWLEFYTTGNSIIFYKRVGDTPTSLQSAVYGFVAGDVLHAHIQGRGSALKAKVWKNAEVEPSTWQLQVTDTSHASGRVYCAINGGANTVTDDAWFDNVIITVPSSSVSGSVARTLGNITLAASGTGNTTGTATSFVGAMWTFVRPSASMDSTMAANRMQAQHIVEHGAGNPWPTNASPPSEATWNGQLDPMMQDVRDAGAVEKMIVFNKAPRWMVAVPAGGDDQRPTDANFSNFATISAQAAARYTDFQWAAVWNEYKGFWNNALNRPDYETYQTFYNTVRNAVKAVRPTMKVGGPYTTQISRSFQMGDTTTTASFPGGWQDGRWMTAMTYFIQNAQYDFLCFDMGIENTVTNVGGSYFGADPQLQIQKFKNFIQWVRGHGGAAATVPIIGTEIYVHIAGDPPGPAGDPTYGGGYGYSLSQLEDLYIELCRQTQSVSPGGPLYWLTWCHPTFWPQVVNRASLGAWANTQSPFFAKVNTWHSTGT